MGRDSKLKNITSQEVKKIHFCFLFRQIIRNLFCEVEKRKKIIVEREKEKKNNKQIIEMESTRVSGRDSSVPCCYRRIRFSIFRNFLGINKQNREIKGYILFSLLFFVLIYIFFSFFVFILLIAIVLANQA